MSVRCWDVAWGACFVMGVGFASHASAQDSTGDLPELEQGEGGATVIRGRVLKPEVTVLVRRRSVDADIDLGLDRTFLDRLRQTPDLPIFEEEP